MNPPSWIGVIYLISTAFSPIFMHPPVPRPKSEVNHCRNKVNRPGGRPISGAIMFSARIAEINEINARGNVGIHPSKSTK